MGDAKIWTDLATAAWLVWLVSTMKTDNARSTVLFKTVPLFLAVLLAMSQARALFP